MLFKLKPGLKVRDYRTREFIPAEGVEVPATDLYFAAMVRDGDGEFIESPDPKSDKPKARA